MWLRDTPVATDAAIFFFVLGSTLAGLWKMETGVEGL